MLKIALICGGPSLERGISLNSARSVIDHLSGSFIQTTPLYVDRQLNFYLISPGQLYSNTPSDFDFKLETLAKKISDTELRFFFEDIDLAFPVIHGEFGEDGELQKILEEYQVPYVGSDKNSCRRMFNKHHVSRLLEEKGFFTIPSLLISQETNDKLSLIEDFFHQQGIKRAVVKPVKGGSSIGVFSVSGSEEALEKCKEIFCNQIDDQVLIESFCFGQEFTIIVLENHENRPVALMPTEIEMNYDDNQIFDYRRKYLPTNQVTYHTPPHFDSLLIDEIRREAEEVFKLFNMRDFVRLDGWVLPDGRICFSDINPISGLEQNSFLFRQTSILGMTHRQTLHYIIKNACLRANLNFDESQQALPRKQRPVYILCGNKNAERQVSLMSGTNVWLKLLQSEFLNPILCLYDYNSQVWELPYSYALNHTVEEIYQNCLVSQETFQKFYPCIEKICHRLQIPVPLSAQPKQQELDHFFTHVKAKQAFVFIAMHGGIGEDGTLQKMLERHQIPHNGSDSKASAVCMDKYLTGLIINQLGDPDILGLPKARLDISRFQNSRSDIYQKIWIELSGYLNSEKLIIKPRSDGCSAGIALLTHAPDLEIYFSYIQKNATFIPAHTFENQKGPMDLPVAFEGQEFLFEPYLETDHIAIKDQNLIHVRRTGWIELTVGVIENQGHYRSFNPSITVAEGAVLSLEEKFQGGTGINLTPPPSEILSKNATEKIKKLIEKAAKALGIQNYARLDIFFNCKTEKMILIEANTLPALTPSTVFYHQALAENPPLNPREFIEILINSKMPVLGSLNG